MFRSPPFIDDEQAIRHGTDALLRYFILGDLESHGVVRSRGLIAEGLVNLSPEAGLSKLDKVLSAAMQLSDFVQGPRCTKMFSALERWMSSGDSKTPIECTDQSSASTQTESLQTKLSVDAMSKSSHRASPTSPTRVRLCGIRSAPPTTEAPIPPPLHSPARAFLLDIKETVDSLLSKITHSTNAQVMKQADRIVLKLKDGTLNLEDIRTLVRVAGYQILPSTVTLMMLQCIEMIQFVACEIHKRRGKLGMQWSPDKPIGLIMMARVLAFLLQKILSENANYLIRLGLKDSTIGMLENKFEAAETFTDVWRACVSLYRNVQESLNIAFAVSSKESKANESSMESLMNKLNDEMTNLGSHAARFVDQKVSNAGSDVRRSAQTLKGLLDKIRNRVETYYVTLARKRLDARKSSETYSRGPTCPSSAESTCASDEDDTTAGPSQIVNSDDDDLDFQILSTGSFC